MPDRTGSRGGTIHSLAEAQVAQELHKPEIKDVIESAILEALRQNGRFTADDLADVDIPAGSENVIGATVNSVRGRGLMRKVGWERSTRSARHGAENRVYEITELGRRELAGVGAGGNPAEPAKGAVDRTSTDPGGEPERSGPGGGADSPAGPLPDEGEPLQLPLGDVAQAQPAKRRPGFLDDDQEWAA